MCCNRGFVRNDRRGNSSTNTRNAIWWKTPILSSKRVAGGGLNYSRRTLSNTRYSCAMKNTSLLSFVYSPHVYFVLVMVTRHSNFVFKPCFGGDWLNTRCNKCPRVISSNRSSSNWLGPALSDPAFSASCVARWSNTERVLCPIHTSTPDPTKLSRRRRELDSRWLETVADGKKWLKSGDVRSAVVQFTPPTRRRRDCSVGSGGRCELGTADAVRADELK